MNKKDIYKKTKKISKNKKNQHYADAGSTGQMQKKKVLISYQIALLCSHLLTHVHQATRAFMYAYMSYMYIECTYMYIECIHVHRMYMYIRQLALSSTHRHTCT